MSQLVNLPAPDSPAADPGLAESFLGINFSPLTTDDAVDAIMRMISVGDRGWISTVNVAILMQLREDPALRSYVEQSSLVLPDGQPIVWGSRWLGAPLPARVTGIDIIEKLCAEAEQRGLSVFLLGGSATVIEKTAARLANDKPRLRLAWRHGYFEEWEEASVAEQIRQAGADILIVGMGVPRQEKFIQQHWDDLGCSVAIGVGGSFDVISGRLRRAPRWMQQAGLEWFYRLIQEPRRLLPRYVVTNTQFGAAYLAAIRKTHRVDEMPVGMPGR